MDVVERLTLEAASAHTVTACEHIHRYRFAQAFAEGRRVLDLACGVGYGSNVLAESAGGVVGVDNDAAAVDAARAAFERDGVRFEAADALRFLERTESSDLDLLVCFEGLEHLPDLDAVVAQLRRLAQGGVRMVVSVPNSRTFGEENEFHLTDFSPEAVDELVKEFDDAVVLHQFLAEGSLIAAEGTLRDDTEAPASRLAHADRGEPDYANHFLILVNLGDEIPTAFPDARMQLAVAPQYNRWLVSAERTNAELWRANTRLTRAHWGTHDAAAASVLDRAARAEEEVVEAEKRAEWHRQQAEQWEYEVSQLRHQRDDALLRAHNEGERLRRLQQRKVVRVALAIGRLRPGAKK